MNLSPTRGSISPSSKPAASPSSRTQGDVPPQPELVVKPDQYDVASDYNMARRVGNRLAGGLEGLEAETVSSVVQAPCLASKMVTNLWKAETLGPNLKTLGTLAALPATALTVAASPLVGLVRGVWNAPSEHQGSPLVQDSSSLSAAHWTQAQPGDAPKTLAGGIIREFDRLGERKLAPGEKPHDVPLLSPLFALTAGAACGVIGGTVGLVAGTTAGAITAARDLRKAVTEPGLSAGQRLGEVLSAPVNLVAGPVLGWKSLKEAVPRGLHDGWHHGVYAPVAETVRVSETMAESVIHEAWGK